MLPSAAALHSGKVQRRQSMPGLGGNKRKRDSSLREDVGSDCDADILQASVANFWEQLFARIT
jgi:hypothetical protein